jgi:hypothetical protein
MKRSRKVEDHKDVGLNADWATSTYQMNEKWFVVDQEMDLNQEGKPIKGQWWHTLVECNDDGSIKTWYAGAFEECVEFFEMLESKGML